MSLLQIERGLIQEVQNFATTNSLDVKYENRDFEISSQEKDIYLEFVFFPSLPEVLTVGQTGQNNTEGECVINIIVNSNDTMGNMRASEMAQNLTNTFTVGKILTYETQKIIIEMSGRQAGFIDGASYVIPFLIRFNARINRT